jgi:hypothetical protein
LTTTLDGVKVPPGEPSRPGGEFLDEDATVPTWLNARRQAASVTHYCGSVPVLDEPDDLAAQRVDHAMRSFQDSWASQSDDRQAISSSLDELDVAVGLWLDLHEERAGSPAVASRKGERASELR